MENQGKLAITFLKSSGNVPWPLRDIFFGISILILFELLVYLRLFSYRPWIANPFYFTLWILFDVSLILYSLHLFKKHGFRPLFYSMAIYKLFKELFKAFLVAMLIILIIESTAKLSEILFQTKINMSDVWQWTTYDPNIFLLVVTFVMGFTLGPIAEEIFFRGFLYNAIKSRLPISIAAILQAIIFAAYHRYDLLNSFLVFLIGIALVIIYEKRRNLLFPIFVHGIMNIILIIPILILALQNFHIPASNWNEAKTSPNWLKPYPSENIKRQKDGIQQWQYAIDTWGSKGSRQWKMEANAFNAVCLWFPEDRTACAKAQFGIVSIYHYHLKDYRRAIIEADNLLAQFPEQKKQCALALSVRGYSYLMIKDFKNSRSSFDKVLKEFKEYKSAYESAQKGIEWLNVLERGKGVSP